MVSKAQLTKDTMQISSEIVPFIPSHPGDVHHLKQVSHMKSWQQIKVLKGTTNDVGERDGPKCGYPRVSKPGKEVAFIHNWNSNTYLGQGLWGRRRESASRSSGRLCTNHTFLLFLPLPLEYSRLIGLQLLHGCQNRALAFFCLQVHR